MLFNSPEFLFVFLPTVFIVANILRIVRRTYYIGAITVFSLAFYSWTNPSWLIILLCSIIANFFVAISITRNKSKLVLGLSIAGNLCVLFYFKYIGFFTENFITLFGDVGGQITIPSVILPIGISFYTFQKISYLVDTYHGYITRHSFLNYTFFVSFFPQLISGPIVRHRDIFPQLLAPPRGLTWMDVRVGLTIFAIGLFKKLVIADNIEIFASPVFSAADAGHAVTFLEAWGGLLAYTFQIYFDFSGYSDMAIGLGRLFGFSLPLNFNSPYKSANIIDFWRRWHMSLSRFLRDYIYIPLGGSRCSTFRRYANLMIVMLIGGLWHGAGWGFVIWGGLHGLYLMINHLWRALPIPELPPALRRPGHALSVLVTFLAVAFAWVFFRAGSLEGIIQMLRGMAGLNGFVIAAASLPAGGTLAGWLVDLGWEIRDASTMFAGLPELVWLAASALICWLMPNTQEVIGSYREPVIEEHGVTPSRWLSWRPCFEWSFATAIILLVSLPAIFQPRPFLYFQF